jgi:hypothetical protein
MGNADSPCRRPVILAGSRNYGRESHNHGQSHGATHKLSPFKSAARLLPAGMSARLVASHFKFLPVLVMTIRPCFTPRKLRI